MDEKERTITQLKSHNKALQQLLYDGDHARQEALINILEHQTPDLQTTTSTTTPTSRVSLKRCKLSKGVVDQDLKQALEELKAFQPLQTPVK